MLKKTMAFILLTVMLVPLMISGMSISAADAVPALVVTEIFPNPNTYDGDTKDYDEYFEIMNTTNAPIDLYNYAVWFVQGDSDSDTFAATATKSMPFASKAGEYVLGAGECAVCWTVFADTVTKGLAVDNGNGTYTYKTNDVAANLQTYFKTQNWDIDYSKTNKMVIPLNALTATAGFNLANPGETKSIVLLITARDDASAEKFISASIVPPVKSSGNKSFYFTLPATSKIMTYAGEIVSQPTPGYLHSDYQADLIKLQASLTAATTAAATTTTAAATTAAATTTKAAATTAAATTTKAAATTAAATTTKAAATTTKAAATTTKAPTTAPATADTTMLLICVTAAAAAAIVILKKRAVR